MAILVTGVAGFIGSHVALALLARGERVIGIDNLNAYYDPALKRARLARLTALPGFSFDQIDLSETGSLDAIATAEGREIRSILHFAAQAGVRYSMADPASFVQANVLGHLAVLEFARRLPALDHLVYASSSSVYGQNSSMPFHESDRVDRPGSFYAATKRAGELSSEAFSHLYGLPQTGLRFFTVYGPWGRPDMAYFSFAKAIAEGTPLTLYEGAGLARDFTYIDDIVDAVLEVLVRPPEGGSARLLNVGNSKPESVSRLVELLERELGRKAVICSVKRPAADVESTWASIDVIHALTGWSPKTRVDEGVARFAAWFRDYHRIG